MRRNFGAEMVRAPKVPPNGQSREKETRAYFSAIRVGTAFEQGKKAGSCSEPGVEWGVDPGWHAHVFVDLSRWAKGLRTGPRRRGHAIRDDPPPLPEHEPKGLSR